MQKYLAIALVLLLSLSSVTAQSLTETYTWEAVGLAISYPSGWVTSFNDEQWTLTELPGDRETGQAPHGVWFDIIVRSVPSAGVSLPDIFQRESEPARYDLVPEVVTAGELEFAMSGFDFYGTYRSFAVTPLPDGSGYLYIEANIPGSEPDPFFMEMLGALRFTAGGAPSMGMGQSGGDVVRQWATSATATSEYSYPDWGAIQATGAPDTNGCGDMATAWASDSPTGTDSLRLSYTQPVIPQQVNIYQTYSPGSIMRVELHNSVTGTVTALPNSADFPGNTPCPGVFTINVSGVTEPVNEVVIYLEQSIIGNWNEIDAVELVGVPMGGPVTVPDTGPVLASGVDVVCDTGANIVNGTQVTVIQMRPGFTYTATAIGLNGFDPVLAVLDEENHGLCNDDDSTAASYAANLPTTGPVNASSASARVRFSQNAGDFEDVSLVVGGYGGQTGEFLLVLEGMAVTPADVVGDPYSVIVTPGMLASNVPVTIYMLANTTALDPLIASVDETASFYMSDGAGNTMTCDDAGNANLCWGTSSSLAGSSFTNARGTLPGGSMDAMLTIPIADMDPPFAQLTYLMGSYDMASFGDYTIIFHMGIADATTVTTTAATQEASTGTGLAGAMGGTATAEATEEVATTALDLPHAYTEPQSRLTLHYPTGWVVLPDGDSLIVSSNLDFTSPFDDALAGSGAVVMMIEPSYSLAAEIGLSADADPQAVFGALVEMMEVEGVTTEVYDLAGETGLQATFPGTAFGVSTDAKVLIITSGGHTTTMLVMGNYDPNAATIGAILDSVEYGSTATAEATEAASDCPDAASLPPFNNVIALNANGSLPSGITYNYPADWTVNAISDGHNELRLPDALTIVVRLYDTASLANSGIADEGDALSRLDAFANIFYFDYERTSVNSGLVAGRGYAAATLRDSCGNEAQIILLELANGMYTLVDVRNTAGALPYPVVDAVSQISGSMAAP